MTEPELTSPLDERFRGLLNAARRVESTDLDALRDRLSSRADRLGVVDIAYTTIDSPIGGLLLAATDRGLARVAFELEGHDAVLTGLADRLSPRILRVPRRLAAAVRQLGEYFEGQRTQFELGLDHVLSHGFRGQVQRSLVAIPYGHTVTYTQVARNVGSPRAVRAVGSACATNPLPVVVPCHRVLRADGSLGGYLGGLDAKSQLLELESAG